MKKHTTSELETARLEYQRCKNAERRPQRDKEATAAARRAAARALYAVRRKLGLCGNLNCSRKPVAGKGRCKHHLGLIASYMSELHEERQNEGLCFCGERPAEGRKLCAFHLRYSNVRTQANYAARRAAGLCGAGCGAPSEGSKCPQCIRKHNATRRRSYHARKAAA